MRTYWLVWFITAFTAFIVPETDAHIDRALAYVILHWERTD